METVLLYSGPYTALRAARPSIGQLVSIVGGGQRVDEVEIYPREAGKAGAGFMQVTLRGATPTSLVIDGAVDETRDEVEWVPVEKPLETHAYFRGSLTSADLGKIAAWKDASTEAERTAAYADTSGKARDYLDKLIAGVESWTAYAPVIRRTTVGAKRLDVSACGTRGGVPSGLAISGYTFVRTADRAVRQGRGGKWERVQEWTGAEYVDADLYP